MRQIVVDEASKGMRVDVFVSSLFPQFARSALKGIFKNRLIKVNAAAVKASYRLKPNDVVKINDSFLRREPPVIELPILYEDDDVLVINKPAGILTHSKGALSHEPTVATFLKERITDKRLNGNRAGIVHRLDRGTSGVIIAAKNHRALQYLQKQFASRQVDKTYKAIVIGVPKPKSAIIDAPIARNPAKPQTFKISALGKPAQTYYSVVSTSAKDSGEYSLLELKPKTGRTHQLRVHLAYISHPVVGDPLYGRGGQPLMLHAYSLSVRLPDGKKKQFTAPTPAIIKDFMSS